jgi:Holliday junction resolvase RusA-like endonuclease
MSQPLSLEKVWSVTVPGTPVSVNHYKHGGGGAWAIRPEAKAWLEDLTKTVWIHNASANTVSTQEWKQYEVTILLWLGKGRRGDIDNFAKLVLDGLVKCGVLHSDAAVMRLVMELARDPEHPRTHIEVREAGRRYGRHSPQDGPILGEPRKRGNA